MHLFFFFLVPFFKNNKESGFITDYFTNIPQINLHTPELFNLSLFLRLHLTLSNCHVREFLQISSFGRSHLFTFECSGSDDSYRAVVVGDRENEEPAIIFEQRYRQKIKSKPFISSNVELCLIEPEIGH